MSVIVKCTCLTNYGNCLALHQWMFAVRWLLTLYFVD